jgi:MarR-like DNA-binding transcriptional regulator SgrR of sgrS sRNA
MKSQTINVLLKAKLFSIYFCISINAFGQSSNSEFKEFLREKQQSTNIEMPESENLNNLDNDTFIQDLIVPEWNFKEHNTISANSHKASPIETKRPTSRNIIYEPHIVNEVLKLQLTQNNSEIPVTVKIYDMAGVVFYTADIQKDIEIDISLYPPGTYILHTSTSPTTHQFEKIVVH